MHNLGTAFKIIKSHRKRASNDACCCVFLTNIYQHFLEHARRGLKDGCFSPEALIIELIKRSAPCVTSKQKEFNQNWSGDVAIMGRTAESCLCASQGRTFQNVISFLKVATKVTED